MASRGGWGPAGPTCRWVSLHSPERGAVEATADLHALASMALRVGVCLIGEAGGLLIVWFVECVHDACIPITMKTKAPTQAPKAPAKSAAAAKKSGGGTKKAPASQPLRNGTAHSEMSPKAHAKENATSSSCSESQKKEIAAMAYKIWQEQGCPNGHHDLHWRQAEQAVTRDGPNALTA
jgi:hypothetical protein